jgi:hypothetical protein
MLGRVKLDREQLRCLAAYSPCEGRQRIDLVGIVEPSDGERAFFVPEPSFVLEAGSTKAPATLPIVRQRRIQHRQRGDSLDDPYPDKS